MKIIAKTLLLTLPLLSACAFAADRTLCEPQTYEMALRYQQKSAEIMALQLQTYRFAAGRFREKVKSLGPSKKAAVVLDLDETVIDNAALLVRDMQQCHDYTAWDTWGEWEKRGKPALIPGARAFLEEVNRAGVAIFYVSDRSEKNKRATLDTLTSLGLPQVSAQHVLLDATSKEQRRQSIMKNYHIIMLFGDSLPDFAAQFKNIKSTEAQRAIVNENRARFGDDWIVLPNAGYGSWSDATLSGWENKPQ